MWRTITDIYTYYNTTPTDKTHGKKTWEEYQKGTKKKTKRADGIVENVK